VTNAYNKLKLFIFLTIPSPKMQKIKAKTNSKNPWPMSPNITANKNGKVTVAK